MNEKSEDRVLDLLRPASAVGARTRSSDQKCAVIDLAAERRRRERAANRKVQRSGLGQLTAGDESPRWLL